jgi:hypothetical protein
MYMYLFHKSTLNCCIIALLAFKFERKSAMMRMYHYSLMHAVIFILNSTKKSSMRRCCSERIVHQMSLWMLYSEAESICLVYMWVYFVHKFVLIIIGNLVYIPCIYTKKVPSSGLQKSMSSLGYLNHGIHITDTQENTKYTQFDLKTVLCYTRR